MATILQCSKNSECRRRPTTVRRNLSKIPDQKAKLV